ncbi:MAG: hypothetical protein HKP58_10275 [Desulfatitalea sp.]|nr:hypothetical protein [Desulfatitalea sp.]NNK00787.1 hypothetical protein [Desulfatitalea sp.]
MKKRGVLALFLTILSFIAMPPTCLAEALKVAVLPFAVYADQDYGFLQRGIMEMLTSRLSTPGKVRVMDFAQVEQALAVTERKSDPDGRAIEVGRALSADYTIHGSLTVLGDSVSLDAKLHTVSDNQPATTFYKHFKGLDEVIPQINLMAADINAKVLGMAYRDAGTAATAPSMPTQTGPDKHLHPEKMLKAELPVVPKSSSVAVHSMGAPDLRVSPVNPAFQTIQGMPADNPIGFWPGPSEAYLINGVDVGDVDSDGFLETVTISPKAVYIHRYARERRQLVIKIENDPHRRNIGVGVGDINGNGVAEIFISALTPTLDRLNSVVIEFNGDEFITIADRVSYFFNLMHHPLRGSVLLGQQQADNQSVHSAPIFKMTWKKAEYLPEHQILPGRRVNVLGVSTGAIIDKNAEAVVALDRLDHLLLFHPDGRRAWQSSDTYGGTPLYFSLPPIAAGETDTKVFLPMRTRAVDLDGNGQFEVLAACNRGSIDRRMMQRRHFNKSHIEALVWDGRQMATAWKTREFTGRMQDLAVADFDNDGTLELLVVQVTKEGAFIFAEAESNLLAFDLNIGQ